MDGARMQGEILAASRGQAIQIKTARPALVPLQSLLLGVVAEIPDEIAGSRLRLQKTRERFDAVSKDQQHSPKLIRFTGAGKILKLPKTLSFMCLSTVHLPLVSTSQYSMLRSLLDNPPDNEGHFLPGLNARVSVPNI
jgi:hypothetical protein